MTSTRRTLLRRAVAAAVLTGTAGLATHLTRSTPAAAADAVETIDEIRYGRKLEGRGGDHPELFIDNVALHVMRNADGRYSTAMNHYEAFGTLREAAYAAVDGLAGVALREGHVHSVRVGR